MRLVCGVWFLTWFLRPLVTWGVGVWGLAVSRAKKWQRAKAGKRAEAVCSKTARATGPVYQAFNSQAIYQQFSSWGGRVTLHIRHGEVCWQARICCSATTTEQYFQGIGCLFFRASAYQIDWHWLAELNTLLLGPDCSQYGMPLFGVLWPAGSTFYLCGGGGSTSSGIKNR